VIDLFAVTSPFIPADHPMHDYARYVVGVTDAIYAMLWVTCFLLAGLILAFVVFAIQKYWDRKEDERRRRSMDNAVAALKGVVAVLDVLKANMERQLHSATQQVKDEIKKTPDTTAAKVVDAMEQIELGKSGTNLKTPPRGAP
jgi:hypothetical protein